HTVRGLVRVPTVIVAVNFARVPKKRPKLCAKTIRERDDNRCQYTGKVLKPEESHFFDSSPRPSPRSRSRGRRFVRRFTRAARCLPTVAGTCLLICAPFPAPNLRQILAMFHGGLLVLDALVANGLLGMRGLGTELMSSTR